jgi:glycosyltransferase involved in cell wall biosynthesis
MKILALPRDTENPYQELLYEQLRARGVQVRYAGGLIPSQTVNLLLLPLELITCRALGWRLLHIHWVYGFQFPGARRFPWLRRAAQAWFGGVLATARIFGVRVVWTAHNVLPHERVFHDDYEGRRALVRACDVVLVHSGAAREALAEIGATPRRLTVVPHGRYDPAIDPERLRTPGSGNRARRLLFFGSIRSYKGVEELLSAIAGLDGEVPVCVMIVGECRDEQLRTRLERLAEQAGERVELRLGRLPDERVAPLMAECDAAILPFREATTSGSALLAMSHGRPVILPHLPAFAELADDAVVWYDGSTRDLARAIRDVVRATPEALARSGTAASAYAAGLSWTDAAERTLGALAPLEPPARRRGSPERGW